MEGAKLHPSKFQVTVGSIKKPEGQDIESFESQLVDAFYEMEWAIQSFFGSKEEIALKADSPDSTSDALFVGLDSTSKQIFRNLAIIVYEQFEQNDIRMDTWEVPPQIAI